MMTSNVEAVVLEVIGQCRGLGVPGAELDDMAALARAAEPGVALEDLCTQLFEHDCVVSSEILGRNGSLGTTMGLAEKYWKRLEAVSD